MSDSQPQATTTSRPQAAGQAAGSYGGPLSDEDDTLLAHETSLSEEAEALLAETEAEFALNHSSLRKLQVAAGATAAQASEQPGTPAAINTLGDEPDVERATPGKTLTPLGRKWADSVAADMARRTGAPAAVDPGDAAGQMSMFEGAEGPEADAAWRSLVARHPEATVIDDYLIALPADGEPGVTEVKLADEPAAAEPEGMAQEPEPTRTPATSDSVTTRAPLQSAPPKPRHGLLRRLGLPVVWIAALLWVWQVVRTKRLRAPA